MMSIYINIFFFCRKVYSILMCQLAITLGMISLFLYHKPTQQWVARHTELFWIAFAMTIVLIICMSCCTSVRRKAPLNYVFLFLFTSAEAFLLSVAASTYDSKEVSHPKQLLPLYKYANFCTILLCKL